MKTNAKRASLNMLVLFFLNYTIMKLMTEKRSYSISKGPNTFTHTNLEIFKFPLLLNGYLR